MQAISRDILWCPGKHCRIFHPVIPYAAHLNVCIRCWHLLLLIIGQLCSATSLPSQTIGVLHHSNISTEGYILFSPVASHSTYLIDKCGRLVNTWTSDRTPGQSAYLTREGLLYRAGKVSGAFFSGGVGGSVQAFDWGGDITWDFTYATDAHQQHHDFTIMDNGHILLLAWEFMSHDTAVALGRDPSTISSRGLWPEQIVEIKPLGPSGGEVVWQWCSRDHLIQDRDSSLSNFGVVSEHPELIDINFHRETDTDLALADWMHANSIDYNGELDQILLSLRKFNEIWIIDHSTTTEEAASHEGGRQGKGGDLLYRWGNPAAYQRGDTTDQKLFGQHDAHWAAEGEGISRSQILLYNNGFERPGEEYSSIDLLDTEVDSLGSYPIPEIGEIGAQALRWQRSGQDQPAFGSARMSSVQRLEKDRLIICDGDGGRLMEISAEGELLWEFVCPIYGNVVGIQGTRPSQNQLFHAAFYPISYLDEANIEINIGDPIVEAGTFEPCQLTVASQVALPSHITYTNPVSSQLHVFNPSGLDLQISLHDPLGGQVIDGWRSALRTVILPRPDLVAGLYFIRIEDVPKRRVAVQPIILR